MKKQLLITSAYVTNDCQENVVKSVLEPLVSEFDVCMATHSPMSKEIQSMVKYYIYDERNEIIPHAPTFHIWADYPTFYYQSHHLAGSPNHSYAVYRSFINAVSLLGDYYDDLIYVEGDCLFSKKDIEKLKDFRLICERENKDAVFFRYPEMLCTIAFYSKMDFFKNTFPILNTPEEYLNYSEKIGSWRSLENFMLKSVEYKNSIERVYDAGNYLKYFTDSEFNLSSFNVPDKISEKLRSLGYAAYVLAIENTDEIAFLYMCWEENRTEQMDVFLDDEKIYTVPAGPHMHAIKIHPKNEDFSIKIGDTEPVQHNKSVVMQNKHITFVRLKY